MQTWSQPVIKGTPPTPRDSHSCTTVGDNLFVFGGTDGMNPLKDLHILDISSHTWISPTVRGEGPEAREGHSAALVGKRLFIFGGCGKSSNDNVEVYYNDLYILNTETLVWKELNTTGQKLPPRAGHSTVAFGKNLFVFGGFTDAQNLYDDLYMLDVDTGVWTKVMTTGIGPSARFSVAGDCLDPQMGGVLVFIGGCNKSLEALDDMFYLYTGFTSVQDEQRLEKLSLRKQLKLKCQEKCLNSPVNDKALVRIDTSNDFHHTLPTYSRPSRENLQLNQVQLNQGKKTFQAKVTESFPHCFTVETIIDGKPLRGILFANKSITPQMANHNNIRKRTGGLIGSVMLNGDHNNKSKASRTLKQDAEDHMRPDNACGKEPASHESKTETVVASDSKNLASCDVSQICKVHVNPESSVASLNLNDDMINDAPNSGAKFPNIAMGSLCH
ncbi:hypothetical protein GH714_040930 [Hevea brasiliensis]|uniref:DCD domain-containing protein n=1 Tax=Hevea brasiliensis TaxID=3981 RepID=A0A6A6MKI6_HEVBR|nr:hypothetical protein GH714_040930 [Hevea brasiliensis]